jgi:Rod binding domain-containing protein
MTVASDISATQAQVMPRAVAVPQATNNVSVATKAASQFESVFLSQFLGSMFEGISTDGPFGGGQGEAMFRSLMLDEYGKQIEARGGIGLSSAITRQLLHAQEKHTGLSSK